MNFTRSQRLALRILWQVLIPAWWLAWFMTGGF